jgi:hypothetical protein
MNASFMGRHDSGWRAGVPAPRAPPRAPPLPNGAPRARMVFNVTMALALVTTACLMVR